MAIFVTGDMWLELGVADVIAVTTNSTLARTGDSCYLVMGAGAARQAAKRYPGLSYRFGSVIEDTCGSLGTYGVISITMRHEEQKFKLAAFQVKHYWKQPAKLDLIERSVENLARVAPRFRRIALNFPGIGNGQLERGDVLPLLLGLPDNVYIYSL